MAKSKYYAARTFNDGPIRYAAGDEVPVRKPDEGPEQGIRASQVENLLRTRLITTEEHLPVQELSERSTAQAAAAKERQATARTAESSPSKKAKPKPATPETETDGGGDGE